MSDCNNQSAEGAAQTHCEFEINPCESTSHRGVGSAVILQWPIDSVLSRPKGCPTRHVCLCARGPAPRLGDAFKLRMAHAAAAAGDF